VIPLISLTPQNAQYLRSEHEENGGRRRELRPYEAEQILDVGTGLGENAETERKFLLQKFHFPPRSFLLYQIFYASR
jgi:hypothetical protein